MVAQSRKVIGVENKLLEFIRFLGMLIESFKKEVLALFKRLEPRRGNRGSISRSRRRFKPLLRGDRELRKSSCSINYDEASIREKRRHRSGWEIVAVS